ncbi:MAG: protein phosphatase 2C domain-containing protein [Stackebrandtia sp.]
MEVSAATRPQPGRVNDDAYIVGPSFAAVLDGCTEPVGRDSGCVHDVPWLTGRLCARLAAGLFGGEDRGLDEILAEAIARVRDDHGGACDLSNPDSPSSTATLLRLRGDAVDYLVLGDSPLALRTADGAVEAIVDDRVEHLPSYTYDAVARLRNHADGFWVASTEPEAAARALSGSRRRADVASALLLTDGASRLVDRYGRGWADVMSLADKAGPEAVVCEAHEEDARVADVRGKRHDDATVVFCRFEEF